MEFLRFTKLFALCIACCLAVVACSDDKEEGQPEQPEVERDPYYELQYLETMFSIIPNPELIAMADVSCTVVDYDGSSKTYTLDKNNVIDVSVTAEQPDDPDLYSVTRAPWINLPVTAKATINVTFKVGFTPDAESEYDISIQMDGMMTAYNSFGNVLAQDKSLKKIEQKFSGAALSELLESTFPYGIGFKCEFVNGKYKVTKQN